MRTILFTYNVIILVNAVKGKVVATCFGVIAVETITHNYINNFGAPSCNAMKSKNQHRSSAQLAGLLVGRVTQPLRYSVSLLTSFTTAIN